MKKIFTRSMAICMMAALFSNATHAQQPADISKVSAAKKTDPAFEEANRGNALPSSSISIKAVRDFIKSFKNVTQAAWYQTKEGPMVYFINKGIKTRSAYDEKGNWLHDLRTFTEKDLPGAIREQVKSKYYDYTITCIDEVSKKDELFYLVHIEDNNSIKIVRVQDGEDMQVVKELGKAH